MEVVWGDRVVVEAASTDSFHFLKAEDGSGYDRTQIRTSDDYKQNSDIQQNNNNKMCPLYETGKNYKTEGIYNAICAKLHR